MIMMCPNCNTKNKWVKLYFLGKSSCMNCSKLLKYEIASKKLDFFLLCLLSLLSAIATFYRQHFISYFLWVAVTILFFLYMKMHKLVVYEIHSSDQCMEVLKRNVPLQYVLYGAIVFLIFSAIYFQNQ